MEKQFLASDGTRLQRSGGVLVAPGGVPCTTAGAVLDCPR